MVGPPWWGGPLQVWMDWMADVRLRRCQGGRHGRELGGWLGWEDLIGWGGLEDWRIRGWEKRIYIYLLYLPYVPTRARRDIHSLPFIPFYSFHSIYIYLSIYKGHIKLTTNTITHLPSPISHPSYPSYLSYTKTILIR